HPSRSPHPSTRSPYTTLFRSGVRAMEAERAAKALGVHLRLNAALPDAHLENNEPSRAKVVTLIRQTRPRVVILPFPIGRHPDHRDRKSTRLNSSHVSISYAVS